MLINNQLIKINNENTVSWQRTVLHLMWSKNEIVCQYMARLINAFTSLPDGKCFPGRALKRNWRRFSESRSLTRMHSVGCVFFNITIVLIRVICKINNPTKCKYAINMLHLVEHFFFAAYHYSINYSESQKIHTQLIATWSVSLHESIIRRLTRIAWR